MKLNMKEELPKNEQGASIIGDDIREIIDTIYKHADSIKHYAEQMKKWTSGSQYITTSEYEGMQYNIRRVKGLAYLIGENADDLGDDFDV